MGGATNEGFDMDDPSSGRERKPAPIRKAERIEDFDELLEKVGSTSTYQKWFLYAILGPITALMPFFSLSSIFLLSEPKHWCHVPGMNGSSLEEWKNLTIPMETGSDGKIDFSQCKMYNESRDIVDCQFGWEYDKENYDFTIPSQFDWVCSKSYYVTSVFTMQTVGSVFGVVVFGYLADKIGRKTVFFVTAGVDVVFRFGSLFLAYDFTYYLISQFLNYTAYPLLFIAPTIIAAEISGKDFRGWVYGFSWMIWVVGMAILPIVAWLTRTWFTLGVITSLSTGLIFLTYPFVPESPRWLLSMGRTKDAARVMETIGKKNGMILNREEIQKTLEYLYEKEQQASKDKHVGFWSLFSKPRVARNTIMLGISWSVNKIVYYGITLNASHIVGNEFLIFFILAVIELPSGYLGGILVEKVGRRWTSVVFFFICGLTCFAATAGIGGGDSGNTWITVVCIVIAKFAITLTFLVVYMQGAEIFPTNLRSTGSSFSSLIATAFSTAGPYMIYLGKLNANLPYVTMGCISFLGLLAASLIPETLNRNLPETLEQANDFGKNDKFFALRPNNEAVETRQRKPPKDGNLQP